MSQPTFPQLEQLSERAVSAVFDLRLVVSDLELAAAYAVNPDLSQALGTLAAQLSTAYQAADATESGLYALMTDGL